MSTIADNTASSAISATNAVGTRNCRLVRTGARRRFALTGFLYFGGLILAIAWLQSGAAHLANPYYFLSSVYRYELVGPTTGKIVAMVLPIMQLFLAVCLIGRVFVSGALLLSSLLLGIFLAVQASAVSRDLNIACGCFGAVSSDPIGGTSISMVGGLLLLAVTCFVCDVFVLGKPTASALQTGLRR